MSFKHAIYAAGCSLLIAAGTAQAREVDGDEASAGDTSDQAVNGSYSPFLHGPLAGAHVAVSVNGGWDAATGSARADASGWMPLYGRVSMVLGAHLGASETWRPSAGLAISLWDAGREGSAGQLLLQYKAEGFSEPEGELELTLRSGYRSGIVSLFVEGSYGQDPEAHERDAELATDASLVAGHFSLGVGARGRKGLGEKQELVAWDLAAGPHLGLLVSEGHFLGVAGGLSLVSIEGETRAGVLGLASYAVSY